MAGNAAHTFVAMNACGGLVYNNLQLAFELGVAIDASILRRLCHQAGGQHDDAKQPPTGMRAENPHLPIWLPRHVSDHAHRGEVDHHKNDSYPHPMNATCSSQNLNEGEG